MHHHLRGAVLEAEHIQAMARVKAAAAKINAELGVIADEQAKAIQDAAAEIVAGEYLDQFPIDVFQTGSGTSSNMNMKEVLASLAARAGVDVHPNDHVNASQSSNDTFPTSIHVAATSATVGTLVPALDHLATTLEAKASEFADVVKSGRTHLMDATPVMLGQELGGYAAAMRLGVERLEATLPRVAELPLGGTAVGTGINTPEGFAARVIAELAESTGLPFTEARNHFEAQGARDALVELSGQLRTIAVGLTKLCTRSSTSITCVVTSLLVSSDVCSLPIFINALLAALNLSTGTRSTTVDCSSRPCRSWLLSSLPTEPPTAAIRASMSSRTFARSFAVSDTSPVRMIAFGVTTVRFAPGAAFSPALSEPRVPTAGSGASPPADKAESDELPLPPLQAVRPARATSTPAAIVSLSVLLRMSRPVSSRTGGRPVSCHCDATHGGPVPPRWRP